ncbi:DNA-binding CsgD family transcriptional regulator [Natronocella acetinitrilica]|uniref:DNA-binding CsgD family transcriptional regulator n=1 Tax=Natronocella acetinitrilica TaxID=414046 RepID=A0AAE3G272_9GAMM|nr:LuxR C-terminal-related transcriptional regulator [Natronocella acetinitrilica]MCP1673679.1 DNA-binding CsgD family transcriptional regulator [Natronocella acetinitrilica]
MDVHRRPAERRAEARIQQLCCLGFSEQVVIPLLLREIHGLIPSHWNLFFWFDIQGNITNLYNEYPPAMDVAALYLNEFHNAKELEVFRGWSHVCRHSRDVSEFDRYFNVPRREFLRHAFYQEVLKPAHMHWMLQGVVRDGDRPLGMIGLTRSPADPLFAKRDSRLLQRVNPFVAHAMMNAGREVREDWVDSDDEGLVICDERGAIRYMSDQARLLLVLAQRERFRPRQSRLDVTGRLDRTLQRLTHALIGVRDHHPNARPPSMLRENAWGRFRFTAGWLNATRDDSGLVGITVRRQEPVPLKLMRKVETLALPRRQAQVCLWMACGHSYASIADRLGVSESTVISHGRAVYNRLDAHNRSELISRLLAVTEP